MAEPAQLLSSAQVAQFVALGYLRFDGLVDASLNEAFVREYEAGPPQPPAAGTPLPQCYPPDSAVGRVLALPRVAGAIESLMGPEPRFDHHFYHVKQGRDAYPQPLHQDSTVDPRIAFDIQLMYFPEQVTERMGGTRFVSGSHLRLVNEQSIARYQNIVGQQRVACSAGTLLVMHHGIWHGAGRNQTDRRRIMFKLRLGASQSQARRWDMRDLRPRDLQPQPIFTGHMPDPSNIQTILCTPEPWYEGDTMRLEFINRIRLWRYLLGDPSADANYWLTRLENTPGAARPSA